MPPPTVPKAHDDVSEDSVLSEDALPARNLRKRHEDFTVWRCDAAYLATGNPVARGVFIGVPLQTGSSDAE